MYLLHQKCPADCHLVFRVSQKLVLFIQRFLYLLLSFLHVVWRKCVSWIFSCFFIVEQFMNVNMDDDESLKLSKYPWYISMTSGILVFYLINNDVVVVVFDSALVLRWNRDGGSLIWLVFRMKDLYLVIT